MGLLLASGSLFAQHREPSPVQDPLPTFPAAEQLVWIDVVALDAKDRPASGLSIEDFEVEIDGRRRRIEQFREFSGPAAGRARSHPAPPGNTDRAGRSFVLLLDDVALRPRHVDHARKAVDRLLSLVDAGDRIHVIATESGVSVAGVAPEDVPAVRDALARVKGHLDQQLARLLPLGAPGPSAFRALYWARIESLTLALETLRERSGAKALVLIGPSLPYSASGGDRLSSRAAYDEVMRASQRAGAPVYFLDCQESGARLPAASGQGGAFPAPVLAPYARGSSLSEAISLDSGGLPTHELGAWEWAVERIVLRTRASYLLGVSHPDSLDGRYHRIEVRARPRGVRIQARKGYFGPAS